MDRADANIVLKILLFQFPFSCPEDDLKQTKADGDLWGALVKLPNKLLIFLSSLSAIPYPHAPGLEFPVDGPVQTPTLLQKTNFEDEHERRKNEKTTEQKCVS